MRNCRYFIPVPVGHPKDDDVPLEDSIALGYSKGAWFGVLRRAKQAAAELSALRGRPYEVREMLGVHPVTMGNLRAAKARIRRNKPT